MNQKIELARKAAYEALRLRKSQDLKLWQAICVYDLAEELGLRVYFNAAPSMEGMYMNLSPPRIILSALRPAGRMAYTCAHEIGHHILGHGARVDEELADIDIDRLDAEEYTAECFAGFLLMPKIAVSHGFAKRGWDISACTPEQLYVVAEWLGVGYTALIWHMSSSLKMIVSRRAQKLVKVPLRKIRVSMLNQEVKDHLVVVDKEWFGRPIDIQVGDMVLFEHDIGFEGNCIEPVRYSTPKSVYKSVSPGIGRCFSKKEKWAEFVRVSRKEYIGQCRYRHLEEPIDE